MGLVENQISTQKQTVKKFNKQSSSLPLHLADSPSDTTVAQSKKQSPVVGKPSKKLTIGDDDLDSLSNVYKNIKKDETPKSSEAKVDKKESSASTKDTVAKKSQGGTTSTTEESYELSEPNTVRSILDRAKEVLKTLDADALPGTDDAINKRGGIAKHKDTATVDKSVDAKFVNDTARAVKQVAQLAQNLVKHAQEKQILKNKTMNLLKKSTPENPKSSESKQQQQQHSAQNSTAAVKQTIVKQSVFPKMVPRQFGNTP